ncbi:hypothetical protein BDF22DRAFT_702838 [Syncephalis plumigaleata]|nr:hypothetical protein BDF22DRAFT_702838 [Syncephalis plumigaleata]
MKYLLLLQCCIMSLFIISAKCAVVITKMDKTIVSNDPPSIASLPFNVTGVLVRPLFIDGEKCSIEKAPSAHVRIRGNGTDGDNAVIFILRISTAIERGCATVDDIISATIVYNQWANDIGIPEVKAIILLDTFTDLKQTPTWPFFATETFPHRRGLPIPVTLIRAENVPEIRNTVDYQQSRVIATVTHDPGKINRALFSSWFQTLRWASFVIIVMFFLHAFGNIIFIAIYGKFEFDLRTLAFALAFISVIMALISFPMEHQSIACQFITCGYNLLFTISYYFLLAIWYTANFSAKLKRRIIILRSVIHISFVLQITARIVIIVTYAFELLAITRENYGFIYVTANSVLFITDALTAIIFAYYASIIYQRMNYCVNNAARNALARFALISVAASATMLITGIQCMLYSSVYWSIVPDKVIARRIYGIICLTAKAGVLLYMFGIRMPEYPSIMSETFISTPCYTYRILWCEIKRRLSTKTYVQSNTSTSTLVPSSVHVF